jgi:hypothetical protein
MIQRRTVLIVVAVALVTGLIVRFGMRTRHPLLDIDGIAHGTLENSESEVTLLFFLGTTCPISAQYAPEIIDICRDYESKGTACLLVFPEPSATSANLREYLREFGYKSPGLLDESHTLVKKAGATVTPRSRCLFSIRKNALPRKDRRSPCESGRLKSRGITSGSSRFPECDCGREARGISTHRSGRLLY